MSEICYYYKGVHPVKVLTESEGYLIVEAVEDFEDQLNGKRVNVRKGERRIVSRDTISKKKKLPPIVKEHAYELEMEKKLKELLIDGGNDERKLDDENIS